MEIGYLFALLGAIFFGVRNGIIKKVSSNMDEYSAVWVRSGFALPFLLPTFLLFFPDRIDSAALFYSFLAAVTQLLGNLFHARAVTISELSVIEPLLSFNIVMSIIISFFMLSELPDIMGFSGVFLIFLGSYLLTCRRDRLQNDIFRPFRAMLQDRGAVYALIVSFLYTVAAIYYKKAILLSNTYFAIFLVNLIAVILLTPLLMKKSSQLFKNQFRKNVLDLILLGFFAAIGSIFLMLAMERILVSYVIAIRQTSMFVGIFLGNRIFSEGNIMKKLRAALIIMMGVIIITFSQVS